MNIPIRSNKLDLHNEKNTNKFAKLLASDIDLNEFQRICRKGIPDAFRPTCWQILLRYRSCRLSERTHSVFSKRALYQQLVDQHCAFLNCTKSISVNENLQNHSVSFNKSLEDENTRTLLAQIRVDVPRIVPRGANESLFKNEAIQKMMEQILFVWSEENSSIGYFQGIGDILGQLVWVFLSEYIDVHHFASTQLNSSILDKIAPDCYWCLNRILLGMKNHITHDLFEGIRHLLSKMSNLLCLIDVPLIIHFQKESMEFMHFSFRWMLCLLTRELNVAALSRLWDSYFAEGENFTYFHVYVCTALLETWSSELQTLEFSELMLFLQHLPTEKWSAVEVEKLIESAYQIGYQERYFVEIGVFSVLCSIFFIAILYLIFMLFLMLHSLSLFFDTN